MQGIYLKIFDLAGPYLDTRDNDIHTRIAYSFAVRLLEAEGGDERVVLPAILLHDLGWKMVPEDLHLKAFGPGKNDLEINRIHEVEGAKKAREILESVNYDPELTEQIVTIISGHDSRKEALSLNDAIVKDSDRLWRFSEEALEVDPKRFRVDPAVHTEWLKHQIDHWFYTQTAKKLAREEQKLRAINFGLLQEEDQ
ncbi:MAG: HD domain-containing protein [Desulfomonile tiedjei]|nr:HD domain-containing protein [Desulfomonile tiedjei]